MPNSKLDQSNVFLELDQSTPTCMNTASLFRCHITLTNHAMNSIKGHTRIDHADLESLTNQTCIVFQNGISYRL